MELKELIEIFRKQRNLFLGIVLLGMFGAWVWQERQEISYEAMLLINIGRAGVSETTDYTYDSFYRLQADERFADTVVRWLGTPRVVADIYEEADLDSEGLGTKGLASVFRAGRLSSQIISVTYGGDDKQSLERLADASVSVLNRYTDTLNTEAREKSWFVVIGSDPVIRDARVGLHTALFVGLAVGLFFGFWIVLFRYYFSRQ